MACSAKPLEAGYASTDEANMYSITPCKPFKVLYDKFVPLFETNTSGIPNCTSSTLSLSTVAVVVVEFIGNTSIYFEWASITNRNL